MIPLPDASAPQRCPRDLRMICLLLDGEHEAVIGSLVSCVRNRSAVNLLRGWRYSGYPFVALGGELHRRDGGIIGGFAPDWHHLLRLVCVMAGRFDEIVEAGSMAFSSAWLLHVTPKREGQLRALIAELQQTSGAS